MKILSRYFIPINLLISLVVTTVLYFCNLEFIYFLFGTILALITHALMVLQNNDFFEILKAEETRLTFHPKKTAILWYLLRVLIIIGYLVLMVFLSDIMHSNDRLVIIITFVAGYLTVKILFILTLLKRA